jgi:hypothetical protein
MPYPKYRLFHAVANSPQPHYKPVEAGSFSSDNFFSGAIMQSKDGTTCIQNVARRQEIGWQRRGSVSQVRGDDLARTREREGAYSVQGSLNVNLYLTAYSKKLGNQDG